MSWRKLRLGEVLTLKRGHDLPSRQRLDGEVPIISSSGITGFHNEAKAIAPGVVTGRYGTLGQVFYTDEDYWPLNTALYVTDFKGSYPRFTAYFLQNLLSGYSSDKAAVPGVDRNVLHGMQVCVPDVITQQSIASTLSAYDGLIENNRRRIKLLERSAHLLYREWFVHLRFPGHQRSTIKQGVPQGWENKRISEICETVGGGTPSTKTSEYWDGDITWVVPSDITNNDCVCLLDSGRRISERGLRESSAKMVPANTILMTSRASVGFFALVDHEVCTNQGFINIIPPNDEMRMYMLFNLMSRADEIRANAKGSTYPEISKGRFREMTMLVPPQALTKAYAAFASDIVHQVRNLKQTIQKLHSARDLLLPRLMSGKLTVPSANQKLAAAGGSQTQRQKTPRRRSSLA